MRLPLRIALEHVAPLSAVVVFVSMFAHVLIRRVSYPNDLEWMTGAMLDHVERVRSGSALYVEPSVDWIPFLYPPLYYWLSALLGSIAPFFLAARGLSILSTFVQAGCVWLLALEHGATKTWALVGVGLFFAAFSYTGFWYDIERVDSLYMALVSLAAVVLCRSEGLRSASIAGILAGVAFFAKQPAVFFLAGAATALLWRRLWTRAFVFAASASLVVVGGCSWLHATTDGWFTYYVVRMPLAHGGTWELLEAFLWNDLPRGFALVAATASTIISALRRDRTAVVFAGFLLAGFLAAASGRAHPGGWDNVLMSWTTFAVPAVVIAASRLEAHWSDNAPARLLLGLLVTLQFCAWSYDPHSVHPKVSHWENADLLPSAVRALEAKGGEVLVTGRGQTTTPRHFHQAALVDVWQKDGTLPDRIAKAFADQRFSAVLINGIGDLQLHRNAEWGPYHRTVTAHYYVAEKLDERIPSPVVGSDSRPTLLLRPRAEILDVRKLRLLQRRQAVEVALVELHEDLTKAGIGRSTRKETVEQLAKRLVDRRHFSTPSFERERVESE